MFNSHSNIVEETNIPEISTIRKPIKEIYIAVDACAELGGQPYKVLEQLQKVYQITGRRNLHFIDTEQGFHEKSNCTVPAFIPMLERQPNGYVSFLQKNPEWTKIVSTPICYKFREDLATKVIPKTVQPLMKLAEETSDKIRHEAFRIMQERKQSVIAGKKIHKPSDIDVKINISDNNPVFVGGLLNEAAHAVLPFWKERVDEIPALNINDSKKHPKGFMADMIKASQEIKAFSYAFVSTYSPSQLKEIRNLPSIDENISKGAITPKYLKKISELSHIFSDVELRNDDKWWEQSEVIQALRMTKLWPWTLKGNLSEDIRALINSCHKNTADMSYLKLYSDIIPELSTPQNTLFIIITNDGPLISQFLEVSTGVSKNVIKEPSDMRNGKRHKKSAVFNPSSIYEQFCLSKKEPEDYPHQAAWAGSEFVRFVYKEVLYSIKDYIEKDEMRSLVKKIKENSISKQGTGQAYSILRSALEKADSIPSQLKEAIGALLEKAHDMERFVSKDIQNHGRVLKEGRYDDRQYLFFKEREKLQINKEKQKFR